MMALKVSHWVNVILIMIDLTYHNSLFFCDLLTYSCWHKLCAMPVHIS